MVNYQGVYSMEFSNKVIVISGTNSGIGRVCAQSLIECGSFVVGLDIKISTIEHERYSHFKIDIRDEKAVIELADYIAERFGRIHGLVNCVGIYASEKPFYEIELNEWNNVISSNLTGMFIISKYITRKMLPFKDGKIVNISCIRSSIFRPKMADYAASKSAVVAFTSAMALDLKEFNIQVNSVAPGFTYTGMTQKPFDNPEIRKFSESIIPVGRIAEPEDIANVVFFLLSDKANYINGETIFVDGGFRIEK